MTAPVLNLYSDGGSRNNPGPAAAAYLLCDAQGKLLERRGVFLGQATNNAAEYHALRLGLSAARKFKPQKVVCHLDSELVVRQLNGLYKVKDGALRELVLSIQVLVASLAAVEYRYVPRERNAAADRLVNQILDSHS